MLWNYFQLLNCFVRSDLCSIQRLIFSLPLPGGLQCLYPTAEIGLEYPLVGEPNKHIDILVRVEGLSFIIEIKYKTKKLSALIEGEQYNLKNHGA